MGPFTLKRKMSKADFRRRAAKIVLALATEVGGFEDTSEPAIRLRVERSRMDHFYFFKTYLPHYFNCEPAGFHREIIDLLDVRPDPNFDEVLTPVAVAAPREFAKTTITSFGYVLHQVCHKLRNFVILGSDTKDLASDLAGYLYLEMQHNERLKCDFGPLVEENWAVDDFVTKNDVRILCRGRGQRLRGLKHKQFRPDLVILDDLENDENVKNPRIVKELLRWVVEAVYPGIDATGNLFWIGTILARLSALGIVVNSKNEPYCHWTRRLYQAIQEDGTSLWPAKHPIKKLYQQKRLMGSVAFNKEKQNMPMDEDASFQEKWITYYKPEEIKDKRLVPVGFLDPSMTEAGDDKGLITVGLDPQEMIYYLLDAWVKKATPSGMMDAAHARCQEYNWSQFGIEDNSVKDFLEPVIDEAAKRHGFNLPLIRVHSSGKKEARIVGSLSHLVEFGKLRFMEGHSDQDKVIEQLLFLDQPSVGDDGADSLASAIDLYRQPKEVVTDLLPMFAEATA